MEEENSKNSILNNPKAFEDAAEFQASSHHSLHPVGKQQDDAVVADPLGLAWADELVYDALGCVVKISKLGFPEDESAWTGHGKTQRKTWSQLSSYRAPKSAHVYVWCVKVSPNTPYSDGQLLQTVQEAWLGHR